ncbi:MAG: YdcF family protein [Pseudomonadota bacterium]
MIAAIVLGAAVRPDGTPSPTLRLRVDHAVSLSLRGHVDLLIFTGAAGRHGPPEALVARDLALAAGVPQSSIRTETESRSTVENLVNARALLPDGGKPLIVSSRWHLPRAMLAARLLGLRAMGSGPKGKAPLPVTARAILRETVALPLTLARAFRAR